MSSSPGVREPLPGYLFVLAFYPPSAIGGVAQAVIHLVDHTNRAGRYSTYLLICNGPPNPPQSAYFHCPVLSLPIREPTSQQHPLRAPLAFLLTLPWTLWKLRSIIKERDIRAINFQFPDAGSLTFVLLKAFGLFRGKVILTLQGNDIKLASDEIGFAGHLARLSFRLADCVVACSHGIRDDLLRLEQRCERNSVVIHNSIDMDAFRSQTPADFELPEVLRNCSFLLNIGRYEHKKGQDVLIHAFEQVAAKFPDLFLVMIGATGTEIEEIRRVVKASPASQRILMLENVPHKFVAGFLQASLVFVLPSRREGLPFAILEAASLRKPVAAAACVGVPELIEDGVTGRLVPVDDVNALAAAITDLIENRGLRETVADNLYRLVREKFTWKSAFEKYMSISVGAGTTS